MKKIFSVLLLSAAMIMISGCSQDQDEPTNNTPGWSLTGNSIFYKGCVDTAYYMSIAGFKTLTIELSDKDGNMVNVSLASPNGNFTTGTYNINNGAGIAVQLANGETYGSSPSYPYSIEVTSIDNDHINASFSGELENSFSGANFQIANGKLVAKFGQHNDCTPNTNAAFTINAASGTCSGQVEGIYYKDSSLNASHKLVLNVNVTTPGKWSIVTNTINGIKFSGSGGFSDAGPATIILEGSGKPTATGLVTVPVTAGNSNCSFKLNVVGNCNPSMNSINFASPSLSDYSFNFMQEDASGAYQIFYEDANNNLLFAAEFTGTTNPQPGIYTVTNTGAVGPDRIVMYSDNNNDGWFADSGFVTVTKENGKIVLKFCDIPFKSFSNGQVVLAEGKVKQP